MRYIFFGVAALILLRAAMSAALPLSFDEAYYWLWSKRLAPGYFDHPPLVAFIIRGGTGIFGDTEFGVRFIPLLLSAAASWAVWRSGTALLGSEYSGALAALLYNLTLMVGAEALAATPDAAALASAAFFLLALAKAAETRNGIWWLAAGIAAGFSLLAKYTGLFLGAGALAWLLAVPEQRRWLRTSWPYLGAALALVMFSPVVVWNAEHGWASFARQFGRLEAGGFTLRFLGEFVAAQFALATPLVFALGVASVFRIFTSPQRRYQPAALTAWLMAPAIAYFLWHSLHGRVQGNWPSFLYPAFSVAAAAAWTWSANSEGRALRYSRAAAIPLALAMTLASYAHALWGIVPLERDPAVRVLAVGFRPVAQEIDALRLENGATAVLTTSYALTGWLTFYLPSRTPVIQVNEAARWPEEVRPWPEVTAGPFLYVSETWRDQASTVSAQYGEAHPLMLVARLWNGRPVEEYAVYRLNGK